LTGAADAAVLTNHPTGGTPLAIATTQYVDNNTFWSRSGTDLSPTTSGDALVLDGDVSVTRTGSPSTAWLYRTDGKAGALSVGLDDLSLRFDNTGGFYIQSQPRANLDAQDGINRVNELEMDTSGFIYNPAYLDRDFTIRKLTAGQALVYDAGLDTLTLDASTITLTSAQFNIGTSINEYSIDGTLAGNSDDAVPTEQAVKTYVDTNITALSGTYVAQPDLSVSDNEVATYDTNGEKIKGSGATITTAVSGGTIFNMTPFTTDPPSGELLHGDTWLLDDTAGATAGVWFKCYINGEIKSVELD
jgi:hypothetical protein